ncbi:MAG: hypothetical protein QNI91_11250 [Arenicellales bacterium]|nr:hypothetical protein [Arenicellales bacterium]
MNKPERLRAIIRDAQLLSEMAKSDPQLFDEVVSDTELKKLGALTSALAADVEKQINEGDGDFLDSLDLDPQPT